MGIFPVGSEKTLIPETAFNGRLRGVRQMGLLWDLEGGPDDRRLLAAMLGVPRTGQGTSQTQRHGREQ